MKGSGRIAALAVLVLAVERAPSVPESVVQRYPLSGGGLQLTVTEHGVELGALTLRYHGDEPAPQQAGGRVALRHGDGVSEWYEPRAAGVEQGFTAERAPHGDLVVEQWVLGQAPVAARADALQLGRVHYGSVRSVDGSGRELRTELTWSAPASGACALPAEQPLLGCVRLRIGAAELAGAKYPVTIDPLLSTASWTADPTDQFNAIFGYDVAGAGDVNGDGFTDVVVGAALWDGQATDEGRAYLYLGGPAGLQAQPAWMTDPTDQIGADFGTVVIGVGDVNKDGYPDVVVTAPLWDGTGTDEGRAYLYLGGPTGLSATAVWTANPTGQTNANFGNRVGAPGDVNGDGYADVVIGAPGFSNQAPGEGRAYLYLGGPSGLQVSPAWIMDPTDQANAQFGVSVAGAGDVNGDGYGDVIIGAWQWDGQAVDEGRVYLYLGNATGLSASPAWTADPTDQTGAQFGVAVGGAGDVDGDGLSDVVIGANRWDGQMVDEGRAWLYLGTSTGLSASPAWVADPTDQNGAWFGNAVAGAGDVNGDGFADVVVGARYWSGVAMREGQVFLYLGGSSGLPATASWSSAPTGQDSAFFGNQVAAAGDVNGDGFADVVIGAYNWSGQVGSEGRAFAYLGSAAGLGPSAWTADPGNQAEDNFAATGCIAGDVNGDGFADLVLGAEGWSGQDAGEGRAFGYLGGPAGPAASASWAQDPTDQVSGHFGAGVGRAGDVNGDGFADVIVGAPGWSGEAAYEGRAYVYLGTASGLSTVPAWTADPTDQVSAQFGAYVAGAGDVNGDGFADVLISAPGWDGQAVNEGRAYLYLGSAQGLQSQPAWTADPTDEVNAPISEVAGAGDVNGDGYADVLISAFQWDGGSVNQGRAYLYLGGPAGLAATPITVDSPDPGSNYFGGWLGAAGDVNGDGYGDFLVSANQWNGEGRVYLYWGGPSGIGPMMVWTANPTGQAGAAFGSLGTVGDVNGDGLDDLVVGAWAWSGQATREGRAYLFLGARGGAVSTLPAWTADPTDQDDAFFGTLISGGDINGDGFADLLVGAYRYSNDAQFEGRAYVYPGGDGAWGLDRGMRQLPLDGGAPIGVGNGVAGAGVTLRARVSGDLPVAGPLRMEAEVKPMGEPFDGGGTVLSAPARAGSIAEVGVAGLQLHKAYRWRARTVYPFELGASRWVAFGGNLESEPDFRIVPPVDAGSPDSGMLDAGALDAGTLDGGSPDGGVRDGGSAPGVYPVSCGCSESGAFPGLVGLFVLSRLLRRRGRSVRYSCAPCISRT
jgi:hypothetical protein